MGGRVRGRRSLIHSPPKWPGDQNRKSRSRQTKLRRGSGSRSWLVEQGYGVCGARDERPHAGQQQQLIDQVGHEVLPRSSYGKTTTGSRNFGSATVSSSLQVGALRCAATQRAALLRSPHSITSSARCCRNQGTSRPSALAVFRLITNSKLVDCITGKSAGGVPLRIRPA
jgi:hypothetical protein